MPKVISKTLNVTRVSYQTVVVNDGVPGFAIHPDAVFSGQIDEAKAKRLLQAQLGKDAMLVITNVDAGQHRFEMPLDFFVLNAKIADDGTDGEEGDEPDDDGTEPDEVVEAGDAGNTAEAAGDTGEVPAEPTGQSFEVPPSGFSLIPDDPNGPAF